MSSNNLNIDHLMKEAEKMQERMKVAQKQLSELAAIGKSGAGMVEVHMSGKHDVKKVIIRPSLLEEGADIVGEMVAAAFNDAVQKVEKESQKKINELTAGLNLPESFLDDSKED